MGKLESAVAGSVSLLATAGRSRVLLLSLIAFSFKSRPLRSRKIATPMRRLAFVTVVTVGAADAAAAAAAAASVEHHAAHAHAAKQNSSFMYS